MSGSYLPDINIIIALFAGEPSVQEHLDVADEVFVPCVAIGELCFGARKSGRPLENLTRVDEFAADNVVLSCDTQTAHHYGELKAALRARGRPIPENDVWIAAVALQHDLTLVTSDAHFSGIEGLRAESW